MDLSFSEITSFLSLIISCFAAYIAKSSSNKANSISNENLKLQKNNLNLQYGMVELEISQSIENAKSKINEIAIIMVPFVSKEKIGKLSEEDKETLDLYRKSFNAATQTLINYYDSACSKYVDEIVTVSEDEICAAILKLIESEKMVAEGAGAASVAAVMFNKVPVKGKKTVCIVSGGNIDVTILNRVINRGLAKSGRLCTLDMQLDDQPGKLVEVCTVIANNGANITSVHHDRTGNRNKVNACILRVTMETKNQEHIDEIRKALEEKGITITNNSNLKV